MTVGMQALAGPRDRLLAGGAIDPVTAEVIRGTMETVCFEMAMHVSRTATTPILHRTLEIDEAATEVRRAERRAARSAA